jgi:hypothetical protein
MKKIKFLLSMVSVVTGIFSFSSCKQSYKCCEPNPTGVEDCATIKSTMFPTQKAFKDYIKYTESQGYKCS